MRTLEEIIAELKHVTYWSQPNIKYTETMNLLNELEATLNPIKEPVVEEPIVEEVVTLEEPVIEETVIEEPTEEHVEDISESLSNILSLLETGAVEEPIVEVVAPKKTTTRKK
jgi:hypothetical protein